MGSLIPEPTSFRSGVLCSSGGQKMTGAQIGD